MTTPTIETKKLTSLTSATPSSPSLDPTQVTAQKINDLAAETVSKNSTFRLIKFPKNATLGFIAKTAFLTITVPTLIAAGAAGVYFFAPISIPLYAIIGTSLGTGALLYTGGEVVFLAKLIRNSGVLKQKKEPAPNEKPAPVSSSNETPPQNPVQNSSASPSNPIEVKTDPTAHSSDPQPELAQLISTPLHDTQNAEEKKPSEETLAIESPSSLSSNPSCSTVTTTNDSSTVSNLNTSQETTQKPVEQSVQNPEKAVNVNEIGSLPASILITNHSSTTIELPILKDSNALPQSIELKKTTEKEEKQNEEALANNNTIEDSQNPSTLESTTNDKDPLIQKTSPDTVSTLLSSLNPEENPENAKNKNSSLEQHPEKEQNDHPLEIPVFLSSVASPVLPLRVRLPRSVDGSEIDSSEKSDSLDGLILPSQNSSPSLTSTPPKIPPRNKKDTITHAEPSQKRKFSLSDTINLDIIPNVPYDAFGPEKEEATRNLYSRAVKGLKIPGIPTACEIFVRSKKSSPDTISPPDTSSPNAQPQKPSLKKKFVKALKVPLTLTKEAVTLTKEAVKDAAGLLIHELYQFAMSQLDGTNILDQLMFISQDPETNENYYTLLYCNIPIVQTLVKNKTYEAYYGRTKDADFSKKLDQLIAVNPNAVKLRDSAETITPDNFLTTLFPPKELPPTTPKHPQKSLTSPKSKKK